jgi:superoxide dismutase
VSKQVYFVIGVDLEDGVPFIDDETFTARFGKHEQVWDTDSQAWVEDTEQIFYRRALEILNTKKLADD